MGISNTDPAASEQTVRDHTHRPTLTDDSNRTILRRGIQKHGREIWDGAVAEVRQPLRVRPHESHPNRARALNHRAFQRVCMRVVGFAEPRGHDDRNADPNRRTFVDRLHRHLARHRDHRKVGCRWQFGETWIGPMALDRLTRGVDRIDRPLESKARQERDRTPPNLVRIFRSTNDRNRPGVERESQRLSGVQRHQSLT